MMTFEELVRVVLLGLATFGLFAFAARAPANASEEHRSRNPTSLEARSPSWPLLENAGWSILPSEALPTFPPIPVAKLPPIDAQTAEKIKVQSQNHTLNMITDVFNRGKPWNSILNYVRGNRAFYRRPPTMALPYYMLRAMGSQPDPKDQPREAAPQMIVETSGYSVSSVPDEAMINGLVQLWYSSASDPEFLPVVTPHNPILALRHQFAPQVNVLLRPVDFNGWLRSDPDRLAGAIPRFSNAAEVVVARALVPEMAMRLNVSESVRMSKLVSRHQRRKQYSKGFWKYFPADINIEVEFFREEDALRLRGRPAPKCAQSSGVIQGLFGYANHLCESHDSLGRRRQGVSHPGAAQAHAGD